MFFACDWIRSSKRVDHELDVAVVADAKQKNKKSDKESYSQQHQFDHPQCFGFSSRQIEHMRNTQNLGPTHPAGSACTSLPHRWFLLSYGYLSVVPRSTQAGAVNAHHHAKTGKIGFEKIHVVLKLEKQF